MVFKVIGQETGEGDGSDINVGPHTTTAWADMG